MDPIPPPAYTSQLPPPQPIGPRSPKRSWVRRHKRLSVLFAALLVCIVSIAGVAGWYGYSLQPLQEDKKGQDVVVQIQKGMSPTDIGKLLQTQHVIRNASAFVWYTRLSHTGGTLQFGVYRLSPSDSVPTIVQHLTSGDVNSFSLTFLPGATVNDNKAVFIKAGYSQAEVDTAFDAQYTEASNGLIFHDKPASADLEGYIYGDTYNFADGTSVKTVLQTTFDEYSAFVRKNNLISAFQSHGLSLYQGITLASIVQREMGTATGQTEPTTDQEQVAQVFYLRLADGIPLGSDVTYQYAAKKMGVTPSPSLDSPYNTRLYSGLPPGPIAVPGASALLATAHPSTTDYLYFLSGDDGITYFAHTQAEHDANIANHCQQKCSSEL